MAILTPPVISRLPLGLLRFLGIQSGGAYPQHLGQVLTPTWDQLELLFGNHNEQLTETLNLTVVGQAVFGTTSVPQSEVWYVRAASVSVTTDAGEAWSGYFTYGPANTTATHPLGSNTAGASITEKFGTLTSGLGGAFFCGPGDDFGMFTKSITGTVPATILLSFARFPI